MTNVGKRTTTGRRKIEIKLIEKAKARQACFSKRRTGLFRKANELSVLCGAEVAVVVFSPAGKPFSFGHPSVEAVVERFARGGGPAWRAAPKGAVRVPEYARELAWLRDVLQGQKRRKGELKKAIRAVLCCGGGGASLLDGMGTQELVSLRAGLERLEADVLLRLQQVALEDQASSSSMPTNAAAAAVATLEDQASSSSMPTNATAAADGGFGHAKMEQMILYASPWYDFGQGLELHGEGFGYGGLSYD